MSVQRSFHSINLGLFHFEAPSWTRNFLAQTGMATYLSQVFKSNVSVCNVLIANEMHSSYNKFLFLIHSFCSTCFEWI